MDRNITLNVISGFATEETAWKVLSDVSAELSLIHNRGEAYGNVNTQNIFLDDNGRFHLSPSPKSNSKGTTASDIWGLGATIFELLMGVPVFGGRGETAQTVRTPIPSFRKDRYDENLGKLVSRCLSFHTNDRPDAITVSKAAADGLLKCNDKQKGRLPKGEQSLSNTEILKFWPEKMI